MIDLKKTLVIITVAVLAFVAGILLIGAYQNQTSDQGTEDCPR